MEIELGVLLFIQLVGTSFFAVFELGTPAWKKILKWLILDAVTITLSLIGLHHWALLFPIAIVILGTIVHLSVCKKNGIDPIKATPRKKLYALRGWKWVE